MSKELEALEEVSNLIEYYGEESTTYDSWQVIIESLTPPTEKEVCEALKSYFEHYVGKIFYDNESKSFRDEINPNLVEYLFDITYLKNIPPHLITLIGRFYEGVEKVGKEE
jgi:hypothetical protein